MNRLKYDHDRLGIALANTSLLIKLCDNEIISSEYFKDNDIYNEELKTIIVKSGVRNHNMLQTILYNLLVIPKEIVNTKFSMKLEKEHYFINLKIQAIAVDHHSSFYYDKRVIKYLFHMTNALRRGNCNFIIDEDVEYLQFEDFTKQSYCCFRIKCDDVIEIAKLIQSSVYYVYQMIQF